MPTLKKSPVVSALAGPEAGVCSSEFPVILDPVKAGPLILWDLRVRLSSGGDHMLIVRDVSAARAWLSWLARYLMRREARVLAALTDIDGIPELQSLTHDRLTRSYIAGTPMQRSRPTDRGYFLDAGVVHNDLAKEPNLLVQEDGSPAFVDFQLAWYTQRRGPLFRALCYEDIRHLLKHKRSYCPQALTQRERRILANPGRLSKLWRHTVKAAYLFITRALLGWSDREGAGERGELS
jgi:hypothetical protein